MTLRLAQVAEVRLGRQRAPQHEQGDHLIQYLRSANVVDGSLDLTDVKSMNFEPVEQATFGLADGDVLMTEGSGSAETVGTSAVWRDDLPGTVCFQNTLLRLRPRSGVTDGRFLAWWARHAHASGQIAAVSSGANIQHIGSDGLKELKIHVPDLDGQRRIADFLDDRVARIDQIIAARREQFSALERLYFSKMSETVEDVGAAYGWAPLRRFSVGIEQGGSPSADDRTAGPDEVGVLKTSAIQRGRFVESNHKAIDPGVLDGSHLVRSGDLLVTRGSGSAELVGDVAVAKLSDTPLYLSDLTYRVRGLAVDPHFACYSLLSARGRSELGSRVRQGSGPAKARGEDILSLPIPAAPRNRQRELVAVLQDDGTQFERAQQSLVESVRLMSEYKQSLITATVTGELDVTSAGSGIPG